MRACVVQFSATQSLLTKQMRNDSPYGIRRRESGQADSAVPGADRALGLCMQPQGSPSVVRVVRAEVGVELAGDMSIANIAELCRYVSKGDSTWRRGKDWGGQGMAG